MGWQHSAKSEKFNAAKILSNSLGLILTLIDRIQQWKIQEIWNPFHGQNYFILEGIFKLWTHNQQELPFLKMFISFTNQNLAVLCVKLPWNGFRFPWNFWCCMRSICTRCDDRKHFKMLRGTLLYQYRYADIWELTIQSLLAWWFW